MLSVYAEDRRRCYGNDVARLLIVLLMFAISMLVRPAVAYASEADGADRIHFLNVGSSEAILLESNGHYALYDASNPSLDEDRWSVSHPLSEVTVQNGPKSYVYSSSTSAFTSNGYQSDTYDYSTGTFPGGYDNGAKYNVGHNIDTVLAYLAKQGVEHLDFVIASHNHSDHIGGMYKLAYSGLVDAGTTLLHKPYQRVSNNSDDIWGNRLYSEDMVRAMEASGVQVVDVTEHADGDRYSFALGDMSITLYNLTSDVANDENPNSISALIGVNGTNTVLTGDNAPRGGHEQKVVDEVLADLGQDAVINGLQAEHHGYGDTNTRYELDGLSPQNIFCMNDFTVAGSKANFYYLYYRSLPESEQPNIYFTSQATPGEQGAQKSDAVVVEMTDAGQYGVTRSSDGSAIPGTEYKSRYMENKEYWPTNTWMSWHETADHVTWGYFDQDGNLAEGWKIIGSARLYFFTGGIMASDCTVTAGDQEYAIDADGAPTALKGSWFSFGADGNPASSLTEDRYYLDGSGNVATGWRQLDSPSGSGWFYFDKTAENVGKNVTGWVDDAGHRYYLDPESRVMVTGWRKIDGTWYYFASDGAMVTGWRKVGGAWYYLGTDGAMKTGWQKVGGVWYYLADSGVMKTGWQKIDGVWYYFASSGAMQTGWQKVGGVWYYLKPSGAMAASEWVNGYWLNSSGAWKYKYRGSWKQDSTGWKYGDTSGWIARSCSQRIDNKVYRFDAKGYMLG